MYKQDTMLPPPPSPLIAEHIPPGPQPGVIPGPDWHPNIVTDGVIHQMLIPDGNDAITIALFLRVDLSDGIPHIEGTMGLGCPIMVQPLQAQLDQYPRPV